MGSKPWPGRVAVRSDKPGAPSPQPNQNLRVVHVLRNRAGKFGFSFKTIQSKDWQTVTLVKTVKSDCQIKDGVLQPLDQILMINEVNISSLVEDDVYRELQKVKSDCVTLVVTSPASAKLGQLMSPAQPRHPLPYDQHCGTELTGCGSMPSRHSSQTYGSMADSQHSSHNGCHQPLINLPQQVPDPVTYFPHMQEDNHRGHTKSLPVATDDIAVLVEPTQSLPLTALAPQHTPPLAPSSYSHPRSVSGGSGGPWHLQSSPSVDSSSDGGSRGPSSRFQDIPQCRNPCCEAESCTWHTRILSAPHYVVWDPSPITVLLEKNGCDSFQFSYKVKLHEKGEVFSVVTRVTSGGPADGALHVGDNILSCNSTPLESATKAYNYDFEKFNSLKLVIQRPAGILAKVGPPRDKPKPRLPISRPSQCPTRTPSTPTSSIPSRSPVTPTSPPSLTCSCPPQARPAFSPQTTGEEHRFWKFSAKKRVPSRDSAFDSPTSPLTPDSSSLTTPLLPAKPASPPVVLPLINSPLGMGGEPCRHLPKGRLVVCGSKAAEITQRLLSGVPGFDPFHTCPVSFHKLCLCRHGDGSVQFHEWHQDTVTLLRGYSTWGSQQTTYCQVHGEGSPTPILNTEAYVVADENFLQQACHRLCTDRCVYLVTFDAKRLLSATTLEFAALARLLHTIRASAGKEAVIKMYGVLRNDVSAGDSVVGEDEVRTLFYTSLGHQLEVYSVEIPEVVSLQEPLCGGLSQLTKVNKVLLEEMVTMTMRCRVSPAASLLLELLPGESSVFGVHRRTSLASALQTRHPQLSEAACSQAVLDLVQCGELVPLPPLHEGSVEGGEDLVWGPGFLHHLSLLLLESPTQSPRSSSALELAFRLAATATTSTADLLALLEGMTANPRQAVSVLTRAGVIFPLSRDSLGASGGGEYLIPYFLVEGGAGGAEKGAGGGRSELELYMAARSRLSWPLFHRLVSALASHPGSAGLRCPALGLCSFTFHGLEVCLTLQLTEGRIRITINRAGGGGAAARVLAVLQELLRQVMPTQVTYDLGPACPIPCCRPPYLHVLDLQQSPVYCGHTRVDTHSSVRPWLAAENPARSTREDVMSWSILRLKFSVFQALSRRLSIKHDNVPDWRTLADHLGMTMEDVWLTDSLNQGLPAEHLLKEWGSSEQGTIGHLHAALTQMGRLDALAILQNFIDSQTGGT